MQSWPHIPQDDRDLVHDLAALWSESVGVLRARRLLSRWYRNRTPVMAGVPGGIIYRRLFGR